MTESSTRLEIRDGTMRLTLSRPDKLNAIDGPMEEALRACIDELERRDDVRALLIRATGRYFSAGFDLSHRVTEMTELKGLEYRREYRRMHEMFDALEQSEKPSIVAIQGACIGGALELALSCDFRIAAEVAVFRLPEIGLGVIPGSGGISRLTRTVGPAWARWLALAGEPVDAARALAIGLVHEVTAAEELDARADALIEKLVAIPGNAAGLAKLAIDTCERLDRATGRDVERIVNSLLVPSEEHARRLMEIRSRGPRE
jgi:enoyl-CoA hydratase/carnithine racemase